MHTTHYARKITLSGYPPVGNKADMPLHISGRGVQTTLPKVVALTMAAYALGLVMLSTQHVSVTENDELSLLQNMAISNENAQLQLGLAYRDGRLGLKQDPALAGYWLQRSASGGNSYAKKLLNGNTQTTQSDSFGEEVARLLAPQRSISHLESLAESGDSRAQFELAMRYRDGSWGVERNPELFRKWLEKSAAAGNDVARQELNHIETANR